jgi:dienelactone hydrolase
MKRNIALQYPHGTLHGTLDLPAAPRGLILLARAHHAAVDTVIAASLAARGYAILAMELLSAQEIQFADATQNVPRLAQRLIDVLDLIRNDGDMQELPLALFANGDLTPAAIRAAAQRDKQVRALACHGGLIDRAGVQALKLLVAPLQMLFDADDETGRQAYLRARTHLSGIHEMQVLNPGEDPAAHVAAWFSLRL